MDVRLSRFVGPALFAAGAASLAIAFSRQEASLSLVVIIPVIQASGLWGALGILLLLAGFVGSFLAWPFRSRPGPASVPSEDLSLAPAARSAEPARRWGGVLFLGPIPIVFGSDPRVTRAMLLLGLALFLALLGLTVYLLVRGL